MVGHENLVLRLYAGRIGIPQPVYDELKKVYFLKSTVDSLRKAGKVILYQITAGTVEGDLYFKLITKPDKGYKIIGRGEAAAITLTRQYNGILGSNNLRDILPYVRLYCLQYRTSADIMAEALEQHMISEGQGNVIWRNMLDRGRKLPHDTFSEFLKNREGDHLRE